MDVGSAAWHVLWRDARSLGRRPNRQALALIQWALAQRLAGRNTELTPKQLAHLLEQKP